MARGRGGGKTPERVVESLREVVEKSSQVAVANATGLTRLTVQRYLKGEGEPSQETIEKLAIFFGVSVAWLRGESDENGPITTERLNEYADIFIRNLEGMICLFDDISDNQKHIFSILIFDELQKIKNILHI